MSEQSLGEPVFLLLIGALILSAMAIKALAQRYARVPPVVGYVLLGALLRATEDRLHFMPAPGSWTLDFLAQVGVAALLFRVGLRSDLDSLLSELPTAVRVWLFDACASAGVAFAAASVLGLELVPALFVAVACSATSVGVSVAVWEDAGRVRSRLGALLLDVAELDDLSAVLFMLVLVAVAPGLGAGGLSSEAIASSLATAGLTLLQFAAFGLVCWLFARFLERRFTSWLERAERPPDRVLSIAAAGFAVAGLAGMSGFSVAVGALFAGLMFSRDPVAVRDQASFDAIYALFTPLFFIDVGYALDLGVIGSSAAMGASIFVAAALGKLAGAGLPVVASFGLRAGVLMGVSMVPRAEIALLVARTGNQMGDWAVSGEVYGAVVCAAAASAILSPLALHRLLAAWKDLPGLSPPADAELVEGPGEKAR